MQSKIRYQYGFPVTVVTPNGRQIQAQMVDYSSRENDVELFIPTYQYSASSAQLRSEGWTVPDFERVTTVIRESAEQIVAHLLEDDPDSLDPKKEFLRLPKALPDFRIENHGSILLVRPLTDEAKEWLQNTAPEDAQFMGEAMAVEHRYIDGVVDAARADGLTFETFETRS